MECAYQMLIFFIFLVIGAGYQDAKLSQKYSISCHMALNQTRVVFAHEMFSFSDKFMVNSMYITIFLIVFLTFLGNFQTLGAIAPIIHLISN